MASSIRPTALPSTSPSASPSTQPHALGLVTTPRNPPYRDRGDAGRKLGVALESLRTEHPIVVAIPHGGVPVGFEVARVLEAPLEVLAIRRLGVPFQPESSLGAVGERGERVLADEAVLRSGVSNAELAVLEHDARRYVDRQVALFRRNRSMTPLEGRTVLVVDDGLTSGATARVALRLVRAERPERLILAVPVASTAVVAALRSEVDEVVSLTTVDDLVALGNWYADFAQVSEDHIVQLLDAARALPGSSAWPDLARDDGVELVVDGTTLTGRLCCPHRVRGLVVLAHTNANGRFSPRSLALMAAFAHAGLATLLVDLLTPEEAFARSAVYDVEKSKRRLVAATICATADELFRGKPVGYFASDIAAAAALWAGSDRAVAIDAVVCWAARADLVDPWLRALTAPTLLIAGDHDHLSVERSRAALFHLGRQHRLLIIPEANRLLEEPRALQAVGHAARDWLIDSFAHAERVKEP